MRIPKAVPSLSKPTDNKRAAITEAAEGRRPRFKQLATANSDNLDACTAAWNGTPIEQVTVTPVARRRG
jgi:hypothetical protein